MQFSVVMNVMSERWPKENPRITILQNAQVGMFKISQCIGGVAALRFFPSRMRCNSQERDVMGVFCRHHMVVQVSLNVCNVLTVISATF